MGLKEQWKAFAGALEWRMRRRIGDDVVDDAIYRVGKHFRPYLKATVFLGVAGSVGKTTTKDLLLGILSMRGRCIGNPLSRNAAPELARTILRTRPWHRYCVAELGESAPDTLDKHLTVLKPVVGIVTNVGDDHVSAFGSRVAIAREFAKLAHAIPPCGALVLNKDDELVATLGHEARCRVITYGLTAGAELQACDIAAVWPEPLQFVATFNGVAIPIRTQLYGRHLLSSALAAIGGGLAAGLTLDECARGIAGVPPIEGRMQPVYAPGGITYIRDDFKAPAWTVAPLLEQLGEARAQRKIVVLGTVSDCRDTPTQIFKAARKALDVADIAIFIGRFASAALKAQGAAGAGRLHAFSHIRDVAAFLESIRQPGDLVVLKGTNKKDHLSRLVLLQNQTVRCWEDDCGRDLFCSDCSHLRSNRGPTGIAIDNSTTDGQIDLYSPVLPILNSACQVIVGLGNPESEYIGTPHNVGYDAIDRLGTVIDSTWNDYPDAWIASGQFGDQSLWLIKVKSPMNLTGATLKRIAQAMQFDAAQCILIFDDVDLPLGKSRIRMNGSAGGHRGIASILHAFQTDRFRRIKFGVMPAASGIDLAKYVLTPMAAEESQLVGNAIGEIGQLVRTVLSSYSTTVSST